MFFWRLCQTWIFQGSQIPPLLFLIHTSSLYNKIRGDIEWGFARVKQINGINDGKSWSKRPPWKQPKYDRNKKSHKALQKLKGILQVTSRDERQSDYRTLDELRQYYFTAQMELYVGKYPNQLKSFISSVYRHTLSRFSFAQVMAF